MTCLIQSVNSHRLKIWSKSYRLSHIHL